MKTQSPAQIGFCSWSLHANHPDELIDRLRKLGLSQIQLALGPVVDQPAVWGDVQARLTEAGVRIVSGMFGTRGEDYSTLDTIRRTGGFVPDATWEASWKTVQKIAQIAGGMKLKMVSSHAGFIPVDNNDPIYAKLSARLGQVADLFARHGVNFILETGQETADTLTGMLKTLNRPNLGVNFDPANMILYDKGDPIAALRKLLPWVKQVHVKDATRTETPGTWGQEVAIGAGEVDWDAFVLTLAQANYTGHYIIERECGEDRVGDIKLAIERISRAMNQTCDYG